jgi:transposase
MHLTLKELAARSRRAQDSIERSHYQIVWLLAKGHTPREVAESTGYSADWVRVLAGSYNQRGVAGLADHRREAVGRPALLSADQQAELDEALQHPAPDGGLWSGPKVAGWMSQRLGRVVRAQRGWEYLHRLDYSAQVPRPRHAKADPAVQAAFKKASGRWSPR